MHKSAKPSHEMTVKELATLLKISEANAQSILCFIQQLGGVERAATAVKLYKTVTKKIA
jgi:MarR-like DNA-binding transcriptional regulator SgrR of sgrS sRNA